ncbi:hypothetical protein DFJ74DRAFT_602327 [Hyaloraphidium curvatum]|nr:hypothetical protein DFJ74DRAFT_602327 [Hyaloraphidium curvatum]
MLSAPPPGRGSVARPQMTPQMLQLLFALGDDRPYADTAAALEAILLDYVSNLSAATARNAQRRGGRVRLDDVLSVLKRDPPKYARASELLVKVKEIDQARKTVDVRAYTKGGAEVDELFKGGAKEETLEGVDVEAEMDAGTPGGADMDIDL